MVPSQTTSKTLKQISTSDSVVAKVSLDTDNDDAGARADKTRQRVAADGIDADITISHLKELPTKEIFLTGWMRNNNDEIYSSENLQSGRQKKQSIA